MARKDVKEESDYHGIREMSITAKAIPVILHGSVESSKVFLSEENPDTSIWQQRS